MGENMRTCPNCNREFPRAEMDFTTECKIYLRNNLMLSAKELTLIGHMLLTGKYEMDLDNLYEEYGIEDVRNLADRLVTTSIVRKSKDGTEEKSLVYKVTFDGCFWKFNFTESAELYKKQIIEFCFNNRDII